MLVRRVACRLGAELLVALRGTHIGDLHDNRLSKRSGIAGRVRVLVPRQREAAAARVARTQTRRRAERELVDRGGEA